MTLKPTRRDRARASYANLFGWALKLTLLGVFAWFFFMIGAERWRATSEQIGEKLKTVTSEKLALEEQNLNLQALLVREREHAKQLSRNLAETTPPTAIQNVLGRVQRELDAGVSPERLEYLVSLARARRYCSPIIFSRMAIFQDGSDTQPKLASFADGAISLTLVADNNLKDSKVPLSSRRLKARFAVIGGEQAIVYQKLPIDQTVALGLDDYRFRITVHTSKTVKIHSQICTADKRRYEQRLEEAENSSTR